MSAKQIAVLLDARASDDGPRWCQIACVGQWSGHPAGPFELTPAHFAEMVANFKATQNRRIPVDFEHASEQDPTRGEIPTTGAPAQGWMVDLDNRGAAGLWALIEWLEPARTYIREKRYRFFSPTIRFGARDPKSGRRGCRLSSGALTNQPFLDGMVPMAASARAEETHMSEHNDTPTVSLSAINALANNYVEGLVAEGHHREKAGQLAFLRAARAISAAMNAKPSETERLANEVREGGATITQLKDRIMSERRGISSEHAWAEAERMLRNGV